MKGSIIGNLAGVVLAHGKHLLADLLIVAEIGPAGRESHNNAASRFVNQRRHFDQPSPPSARLTLAERIVRASPIMMTAARSTGERFNRYFLCGRLR